MKSWVRINNVLGAAVLAGMAFLAATAICFIVGEEVTTVDFVVLTIVIWSLLDRWAKGGR